MPTRLCSDPGCPEPATYRGKCLAHSRQRERDTNRAGRRVYSKAKWKNVRRLVLFENPLCQCGAIATDVHHKVDIEDGGALWAQSNLLAMCHSCHSRITRTNQGATP